MLHEKQKDVSARFGSKEPDKFAGIDWSPSKLGSPVIEGTLAHIDCTVHSVHDGGDHFVVFGAVHSLSEVPRKKPRPLLFYRGEYTGIEPDKTTPAQWRDDLEAFLTATTTTPGSADTAVDAASRAGGSDSAAVRRRVGRRLLLGEVDVALEVGRDRDELAEEVDREVARVVAGLGGAGPAATPGRALATASSSS